MTYKLVIKSPNGTWIEGRSEDKEYLENIAHSLSQSIATPIVSLVVADKNDKIKVDKYDEDTTI